MRPHARGHAIIEVAIVMAVVMMVLVTGQRMFKAQLMSRWKLIADSFGHGRQYEPKKTTITK